MTRLPNVRLGSLMLAILVATVSACGGGGGGSAPPAQGTLGPTASSVTSSDGKVTVTVGDNALQAATPIAIAAAEPDAATAADPSLVPGTTYEYTAPRLQVPEQVLIRIDSPHAVAPAAAVMPGRARILALPPGYFPPPTCLVNSTVLQAPVQNVWVDGDQCPQAPAPACLKIVTVEGENFNPLDGIPASKTTLCAPAADLVAVPGDQICPSGYREVTGEPAFADFAAQYSLAKICEKLTVSTAPVLGVHGQPSSVPCSPRDGYFLCVAGQLPTGRLSVMWDRTPPNEPLIGFFTPSFLPASLGVPLRVVVPEDGSPTTMTFTIKATDPEGLGGVELVEASAAAPLPSTYGAGVGLLPGHTVWSAPAAAFSGAPLKTYESGPIVVPYSLSDPASRLFFFRVFDRAGNSRLSLKVVLPRETDGITIDSFGLGSEIVLGALVQGLKFKVKGAAATSIDHGVGNIPVVDTLEYWSERFFPIEPVPGLTYTLTATHPTRATKTATFTFGVDTTAPTVQLFGTPTGLIAPGTTALTATASDVVGIARVEFYRGTTLIATDTAAPYSQVVNLSVADAGTIAFTAKAYDAAGNVTTSNVVNVAVGVADVTPPVVSLVASPATLVAPGTVTLQATASDAGGIARVEFYRGATLLDTRPVAPYQTTVALSAADVGSIGFTAKAIDTSANSTTSAPAVVLVSVPTVQDRYASPSGVDAGNASCAQATPCLTIAKAASLATSGATVWLTNGIYNGTTQPAPITIPAGVALRALTPGMAGVGQGIVLQGSASVAGIALRRMNFGDIGWIEAAGGTVTIDGVRVVGSAQAPSGFPAAIALSGTAQATMTPGGIADYADQLSPAGQGTATYATLAGTSRLTVSGGTFGGAALGGADGVSGSVGRGAFILNGDSRLDLDGVTLNVDSSGIAMLGAATKLFMTGSTLHSNVNSGPGAGIHAAMGTPQITLNGASITGFANSYSASSAGIVVGLFAQPGVAATVAVNGATLGGNDAGLLVHDLGTTATSLTLTGSTLTVSGSTYGGIVCHAACSLDVAGGAVSGTGTTGAFTGGGTFFGGIWLGETTRSYFLKLRNVLVTDNRSALTNNTNQVDNSGITMRGNAGSGFDLGSGTSPGNNVFTGNTTGSQTTGLNVGVAAGITVRAIGNTFIAGVQGADGAGKYQLGTAPCGPTSCDLTSTASSGANFRIASGTLRLAQ
ncbi:MAG: hypothetical protein K8R60_11660 [Burkholderiales bacterium]|nr:hypothetical protein [Burkholderiales bacterium]